jgi:hypothetical protein
MRRRGDRIPLHQRIHGTPPLPVEPQRPAPPRPNIKHVWVTVDGDRVPGLLLSWRHTATGWHGRVVRPVLESSGWMLAEDWLPASDLEPVQ